MIRFIVTADHTYTVKVLARAQFGVATPRCEAVSYDELFTAAQVPAATYVFSDIERLSDLELGLASDLYRVLQAAGCRVLNDPARVRTRYALLRSLREAGLNAFDAYRADGFPRPNRFPVFVRAEAEHRPALTGLLPDQDSLDEALRTLIAQGQPLRGLIVIEYCAEPVAPNIFRRYGTFRVGERIHLDHVVTEDSWNVKWGKLGLADEEQYKADDVAIRANHYEEPLARAFDLAGLDYGRADFGLVDGRPQIYEINTNPGLGILAPHPSETRMATNQFSHERFAELLYEIDTPDRAEPVTLRFGPRLAKLRHAHEQRMAQQRAKAEEEARQIALAREERDRAAEENGRLSTELTRVVDARERLVAEVERLTTDGAALRALNRRLTEDLARSRARSEDLGAARRRLEAENKRLAEAAASSRRRLKAVLGSRSWRMTGVLRAGGLGIRRFARACPRLLRPGRGASRDRTP
jgi:FtsZ-binding cell division protein ZapB